MIKNIVFDIGNVLVAFQWEMHFRKFGYSEEILERLAKATVLSGMWNEYDRGVLSEEELLAGFISNDPELEPVIRECLSSYSGMLQMYDYTIPWIKELRQNGYKVYYLSNMPASASRDCAEDLVFVNEMDGGILSWRERMIKPDPAFFRLFLERYDLKPEECVFIDDSEKNIKGACSIGMHGVIFYSREQVCEELRKLGVNELREIMEKFADCGWELICGPAQQWLDGEIDNATLVPIIQEADRQCGNCGCEFDPLYKRALELL